MANADRLIEIFDEAKARPVGAERERFLAEKCQDVPELKEQVISLLQSHEGAGDFLKHTMLSSPLLITERPGDLIGRYKLLEKVGEGGCGVVYVAEQTEPVRRRVALKVIKLGMDTKQVVARFEAERQALAMMDHPNIAKVLEAGSTDTGRPYFVMDLVRGIPITDFCDQNNLSTRERLDLFIKVCRAIQHAHQKGIIHRDIKPSNILVTLHDGVPVPKVIDFGIAKATEGRLTEATVYTQLLHFIGTPAYMSPEQAEMSGLDIDTRSDIYSLGVLLYELLTGKTPFDGQQMMASGIDAMRKTIRETEPVRPSTQLTRELVAGDMNPGKPTTGLAIPSDAEVTTNSRRRLRLKEQINRLRGDLDWIVMKCLEKDRSRRYETANGLAADLNRHLNNEPVTARPPSAAYRFQKAWRRNRLTFTAAAAVATALLIGIGVSSWQAFEANRARDAERIQLLAAQTAQTEERKARLKADAERITAQHHLYVANMDLARKAWEEGTFGRLGQLLEDTRTFPDRGFEWYYWQRQAHLNLQTFRGHVARVTSVAFSPDGRTIVSGSSDRTARVWDAASGRQLFWLIGHNGSVDSVAFSPDGQRIVTGSQDGTARVWDVTSHRELFQLKRHGAGISCVAFSADGQYIVTASADHTARMWDASTGLLLRRFERHTARVTSVAFSPDGRRIVTASEDQTALLWETNGDGEPRMILSGHGVTVLAVAFSPDGERIVTGNLDRTARLWEAASGRELPLLQGSGPISSVAFSPDGKQIATGSWDSTVRVWDAINGTNLLTLLGHSRGVFSVAFSPDGQQIVSGGDETPKTWAVSGDRESLALQGKSPGALAVAISADGRRIVTGGTVMVDGPIADPGAQSADVWETSSGRKLTTLTGHSSGISSAAFSPDGLWIVTGSRDQTAVIWETATGKASFRLEGHHGPVNSVAFSPDGQRIITGSQDYTARVWEVATHHLLFQITGHTNSVTSVGFSTDGTRIVTGSLDNTVRVWEAATGREVCTLESTQVTQILSVAFSPDGESVVAGGFGGAVVWKVAKGAELCHLMGDNTPVSSVAFSSDGRRIVTGCFGGIARVWEAITGRELLTFSGHGRVGTSVAFSRDGLRIVTGSIDLPARVWQAARPDEVAAWEEAESTAEHSRAAWQQELTAQLRKQADEEKHH